MRVTFTKIFKKRSSLFFLFTVSKLNQWKVKSTWMETLHPEMLMVNWIFQILLQIVLWWSKQVLNNHNCQQCHECTHPNNDYRTMSNPAEKSKIPKNLKNEINFFSLFSNRNCVCIKINSLNPKLHNTTIVLDAK